MQEMQIGPHIPDETLSNYALGRLQKNDVPAVFEHLLACEECNMRYEEELDFRLALREAASRPDAQPEPVRKFNWINIFAVPKPAWAAVAALVLLAVYLPIANRPDGPAQVISLTAVRGAEAVEATSGAPILLNLDMSALDAPDPVAVRLVDQRGAEIWSGAASAAGGWRVMVDRKLEPGRYWVRVTNPANSAEQLREFQLDVK